MLTKSHLLFLAGLLGVPTPAPAQLLPRPSIICRDLNVIRLLTWMEDSNDAPSLARYASDQVLAGRCKMIDPADALAVERTEGGHRCFKMDQGPCWWAAQVKKPLGAN
jgi:hypothetical protein